MSFFSRPSVEKKKLPLWKRIIKWSAYSLIGFILLLVLIDLNILWLFGKSPSISQLKNPKQRSATEVYSEDGKLLFKYFDENRIPVKYKDIDSTLIKGLIAVEDARFYDHHGIDFKATASIFWYMAKGDRRGGSTLTQQLVKNLFKTRTHYSQGLFGYIPGLKIVIVKLKEWISALKIELFFNKEDIITMYLNTVDFGNNAYGIKTATKTYFSTTPSKLKVEEAAILIGMLKAPTRYNPKQNPKNSRSRRNTVLNTMFKHRIISKENCDSLSKMPIMLKFNTEENYDGQALYLRGAIQKDLKSWLTENQLDLYGDGLKIYTTIDSRMQKMAEEATSEHMKRLQKRFFQHWEGQDPWKDRQGNEMDNFLDNIIKGTWHYQALQKSFKGKNDSIDFYLNKPRKMKVFTWDGEKDTTFSTIDSIRYHLHFLHAGFLTMEPESGKIKTWVGGIDFKHFKYDHVKQGKRQPGSTFKAFVYTAAIDNGFAPCDRLPDNRVTVNYVEKGEQKSWSPNNADGMFTGENITLKHAMARSINSVTVQLTQKIGWKKVIEYAHKLGIKSDLADVPSVCLGSTDVSLEELVSAYCPLVNGGYKIEPVIVTKITDRNGKVLFESKPKHEKVLSDETAFLMQVMLNAGLHESGGTTQALWEYDIFKYNTDFGGKTGTSSNHSDGWFVGVSPKLIGGAWVGGEHRSIHFRTSALGEGCKTALPIFGLFMEKLFEDGRFSKYQGLFPKKASVKITKDYGCHTSHTVRDSIRQARNDTLLIDGVAEPTDSLIIL